MSSQTAVAQADAPFAVVPRGWRGTAALSTLGTRLSFVVVAVLLLVSGVDWVVAALVVTAQVVGYVLATLVAPGTVARFRPAGLGVVAESAAALVVGAMALFPSAAIVMAVLGAVLGVTRAFADVAVDELTAAEA